MALLSLLPQMASFELGSMSSTSRRSLILGGTGAMGGAAAKRLAERGWSVEVRGRESSGMPAGLIERAYASTR